MVAEKLDDGRRGVQRSCSDSVEGGPFRSSAVTESMRVPLDRALCFAILSRATRPSKLAPRPRGRPAGSRGGGKEPMSTSPPEGPVSSLKLQVASAEGTTIVHSCGRLTAEVSASFKEKIKGLIPGARHLVLDLSDVAFMDSSGLAAIVGIYVSAKMAGCDLRLMNLTQRIRQLFAVTRVLTVFETTGQYFIKMP